MNAGANRIIPRCPKCHKRVGNWLEGEASYTCRDCKTEFIIGDGYVTILTEKNNSAMVANKSYLIK